MTIRLCTGNVFMANADALAHGCNLQGVMGAGIAAEFKRRDPVMFERYAMKCRDKSLQLGMAWHWIGANDKRVFNLMTQIEPGANASLAAIDVALANMLRECKHYKVKSVAMPRIGCGIGGLNWDDVKRVLVERCSKSDVEIQVYHL